MFGSAWTSPGSLCRRQTHLAEAGGAVSEGFSSTGSPIVPVWVLLFSVEFYGCIYTQWLHGLAASGVLVKVSGSQPGFCAGLCAGVCCSPSAEASWAQHSCLEPAGVACRFLLSELNPGCKPCISLPLTLAAALGRPLRVFAVLELQCKHFLVFCQNNPWGRERCYHKSRVILCCVQGTVQGGKHRWMITVIALLHQGLSQLLPQPLQTFPVTCRSWMWPSLLSYHAWRCYFT